jgi:hypothetical protein
MKDVPIPRSRTPIGPNGPGQAGTRIVPFGPEACGHAVCLTPASRHTEVPFRELRTPPWPSWSQGSNEKDASLGGKACGHRVASTQAMRAEGAPLRGSREAMRPHRRADEPGGLQRSTKRATIVLYVAIPECGCTGSPDPPKPEKSWPLSSQVWPILNAGDP